MAVLDDRDIGLVDERRLPTTTLDGWRQFIDHDPLELHNIYNDPAQAAIVTSLKAELYRLKKEVKDEDQFANQQPPPGVD